jgi:hypothetical protein
VACRRSAAGARTRRELAQLARRTQIALVASSSSYTPAIRHSSPTRSSKY